MLLGDAAHTAHFSIGSGTKLAMEDALALAACLHEQPGTTARRWPPMSRNEGPWWHRPSAPRRASLEWFENLGQYTAPRNPEQFAFNIITRSRRVTHDNLRLRDPEFTAARIDAWFADHEQGGAGWAAARWCRSMFQRAAAARRWSPKNRVVVSAMDMYSALPAARRPDFHLVHLGGKALGGAGLVFTEMVCVSADGTDHPGLRRDVRRRA